MSRLSDLDQVAYIRFASVYLDFSDVESFKTEIDTLLETGETRNGHSDTNQLALLGGEVNAVPDPSLEPPPEHSEPSDEPV